MLKLKLPRHAEIWLAPYVAGRLRTHLFRRSVPQRAWLTIADHWEPLWHRPDIATARQRVARWREAWPQIAGSAAPDDAGNPPQYTFFFPEEEYKPEFVDPLAELVALGIADVEVHIHHDGEGRQNFLDRMTSFCGVLEERHGLLRRKDGRVRFGFVHGNWALDNSLPNGQWCGLNDEITLLSQLGCYGDFTMPSAASPTQSRMLNTIYWAKDDPAKPKSYDTGTPLVPGGGIDGDLLMIPGPMGIGWTRRLIPRIESGELAVYDPPTAYRVRRWFDLAPQIGSDLFIKVHAHGAQERHSDVLLTGGLQSLFTLVHDEAVRRGCKLYFVTAWQMYLAIEALRLQLNPTESTGLTPRRVRERARYREECAR